MMVPLMSFCGAGVSDPSAPCEVYGRLSPGVIGKEAIDTPRAVKERFLRLDIGMTEVCL